MRIAGLHKQTTLQSLRQRMLIASCLASVSAATCTAELPSATPPAAEAADTSLENYLATWKIDQASRQIFVQSIPWTDAKQLFALRVMARLALAPQALTAKWNAQATAVSVAASGPDANGPDAKQKIQDQFVRISGRAIFVAPQELSAQQAEIADRKQIDVVRIVGDDGVVVDVLTNSASKHWPRWQTIDEPAAAIGLPLSTGHGPQPLFPAAENVAAIESAENKRATLQQWPTASPALLIAATRVSWYPPTPLGALGVDYGLFDTIVDGKKLVAGDTDAFYEIVAAVGRVTQAGIETAAGPPCDIVPMIDPSQDWFLEHRGEPITIKGTALRAVRIAIDDPIRREQIGTDHYWELFVFVDTLLIKVNDRLQESYPLVCCVRSLPEGMPTGENINEHVKISAFAMKRYEYPIARQGGEPDNRQETPLLIGKQAVWVPRPSPNETISTLGWVFTLLAGVVGLLLLLGAWSLNRDVRKQRKIARNQLPDRVTIPRADE